MRALLGRCVSTAVRAFIRKAIVAGIIWALLGLMVLSWVVR